MISIVVIIILLFYQMCNTMEINKEFNTVFSAEISNTGRYRKLVNVLSINNGVINNYVDIRLYYIDGTTERATKIGVCLKPEEFEKILPIMMNRNEYEINGHRKIEFKKGNSGLLYDLKLTKFDGKESNITLTYKDLKKIVSLKDDILKHCI